MAADLERDAPRSNGRTYTDLSEGGGRHRLTTEGGGTADTRREAEKEISVRGGLGIRGRIHHFTWAWFACTMSTSGISLVLSQTPHRFNGLTVLGDIVFVLDLVLFLIFCIGITTRFVLYPEALLASLRHPTESLFFPTFWVSTVNILSLSNIYGVPKCGPWLVRALEVVFWIYTALTFLVAVGQYFFLFTGEPLTVHSFTPAWILPIFPIMLTGTLGGILGADQPPGRALPILIAGATFQGLGMLVSTFFYAIYMGRLMADGLPAANARPGLFIAVGPPSFTGLALLKISQDFANIYPSYTTVAGIAHPEIIADVFHLVALSGAIFLWATAFWFFSIALVSVLHGALIEKGMRFHLVWWALIFPNVGFTICTISIGTALQSEGILWVGSAQTIILVTVWLFVGAAHIRAVWQKKILWPGNDEDHDQ